MNFRKIYKMLCEHYDTIEFAIVGETKEQMMINAFFTLPEYFDDQLELRLVINDNFAVQWVFDKMDPTLENYQKINDFNKNSIFYKAYLVEEEDGTHTNYLLLDCANLGYHNEKEMFAGIVHYIELLLDSSTLPFLQALTKSTY